MVLFNTSWWLRTQSSAKRWEILQSLEDYYWKMETWFKKNRFSIVSPSSAKSTQNAPHVYAIFPFSRLCRCVRPRVWGPHQVGMKDVWTRRAGDPWISHGRGFLSVPPLIQIPVSSKARVMGKELTGPQWALTRGENNTNIKTKDVVDHVDRYMAWN